MPASQTAATERRNDRTVTHEPPKLKTTLKTPPKQATNPLQFVKVGPCSLYRTAQEQLQKVQEVKKIKQEVREDPEDWQSNLDNWKSSRRKRQEHIIERVVEVKKLELEEHDRQRRRSKTFSEMMEERGSKGRKLSMSLTMYHEEDSNDLSDLGIGTSSGKSSVSGDTHDDTHSVLSDRDSEIEKNHSDVDNAPTENGNDSESLKKSTFGNGFHSNHNNHEYDSAATATASSPEPEEYTYEGAIRGYVSRVSQNIPRRSLVNLDAKLDNSKSNTNGSKTNLHEETNGPVMKVDILKRREIFEKPAQKSPDNKTNNRLVSEFPSKSIKDRLSHLEKQKNESESVEKSSSKALNRLSGDMNSIRERLSHLEKQASEREKINHHEEDLGSARPLRERLSTLEKYSSSDESTTSATVHESRQNGELSARSIKDRLSALDATRNKELEKRNSSGKNGLCFRDQENRVDNSTPSERSSSPDSEYRAPRAAFHRSLDSLDADASSGPDTFERVQSLEELDFTRRYPASSSSAEILNDTDREDSGIHTADVSCSVSQADEPIDEEVLHNHMERQQVIEEKPEPQILEVIEIRKEDVRKEELRPEELRKETPEKTTASQKEAVTTMKGTAEPSAGEQSTNKSEPQTLVVTNINSRFSPSSRPIVYQSPKVPPRRTPPEILKSKSLSTTKPNEPSPSTDSIEKIVQLSLKLDLTEKSPGGKFSLFLESSDSSPTSPPTPTLPASILRSQPSPLSSQDSKSTPCTSPRISKIPTPLPRKAVTKSSPTGSTSSLSSPVAPSSPKFASSKLRSLSKTSEIPVPIPTSPSSISKVPFLKMEEMSSSKSFIPTSTSSSTKTTQVMDSRPAEKRLTVVEVWEKVVVPQGQAPPTPPVTPFITVECFKNDRNSEEPAVIEKAVEEMICPAIKPVDREEVEATEAPSNTEVEIVSQRKIDEESETVPQGPEVISTPSIPEKPERPSTLNFVDNQKSMEMFSPLSQGSTPILPLNLTSDEEIVTGLPFPMGPPTSVEPPKEKPPPPPVELSDEESYPVEPLKRLNSTRRIKKELRTRRSDFLGIGGVNDDDFERELSLTKPPDMAAILAEERRIEQLHRRSYDTDSNYEQDSSHERDSGVELGHVEDWTKQPVSPDISQHSRQSSEPFGASVTSSEEDEITRKEREIIEVLEKEEQWRYGNSRELNSDIGEKLAHKLRELEEEKMQLERERAQEAEEQRRQEETMRKNEENIRKQEEILRKQQEEIARQQEAARVQAEAKRLEEEKKEEELRIQAQEKLKIQSEIEEKEKKAVEARRQEEMLIRSAEIHNHKSENKTLVSATQYNNEDDEFSTGDVLRVERELLQLEQEELQRKRNNLVYREQKQQQLAQQLEEQWKSLQDVANGSSRNIQQYKLQTPLNYRSSMPNLQMQDVQRRRPPPPPIPPAKPLRMVEQRQRDVTIRNSRIPSADSIPQQVDASIRHSASATMLANHGGQQMTRQTLQALSAVPRSRIVQGDQWVQRRKSDVPRGAQEYNYQHWLIQEAEQRRINEKNQRSPVRKPQQHVTGTSVPYTASPPRSDSKPLPDSIIQTLTQRVQARVQEKPLPPRRRLEQSASQELIQKQYVLQPQKVNQSPNSVESQEKMLSVSGKKKCSHCGDELGRGAAMIIESLRLFYHMECFKCCVCHVRLGDGLMGTDVRVRNHKLHCHNCYSSDDGVKFSCV